MTDPTERRRIVWGDGENANLDPFVVNVFGRVYNGNAIRPIKALDRKAAAHSWNLHGDGSTRFAVDPGKATLRGPRQPNQRADELVRTWSHDLLVNPNTGESTPVRQTYTCWLWLLLKMPESAVWRNRDEPPPVVLLDEPPEWLPLAGDPNNGWFEVEIESRFVSVFHGPSVAAWLFDNADSPSTTVQ